MRWKWIFGIVVSLIVVLLVTIYVILSTYDFNKLKPQIAQAAKDATGRELTLGGNIDLKIGLTPALVIENVGFQNAPWGSRPELANIKRSEVQVALLPLIRGNIEVKRLILMDPDILLETNNSGGWNFDFQTQEKAEHVGPKEKAPAEGKTKLPPLFFKDLRIVKGRITYKDGRSGKTYGVMMDSLSAAAAGANSPIKLELKGAYNNHPFEIAGTLGPLVALMDPNVKWPLDLTAKAGGASISIDGAIQDVSQAKNFAVSLTAQGRSIPEVAKLAHLTGVPDVGPFKVAAKVADPGGKLAVENLDIDIGASDLASLKISGVIKDPLAQRGIELNFTVWGNDAANLKQLVGRPMPLKGPFDVSGLIVDSRDKTYKISELKVALASSDLGGSIEVSLASKRPRVTAVLSSQKMDLRQLSTKDTGKNAESAPKNAAKPNKVFPEDPLPLDMLRQADADVKFQAGQLLLPQLALNDLNIDLILKDGHLTVKPLKTLIGGGTLDGRFEIEPQGNIAAIETDIVIDRFDLGRMLKDLEVTETLEGKVDVKVDLKGRGGSVAALMAGLDGKTVVVMGKGRIDNKYINILGADLQSSVFRLLNPFGEKANYTDINCFVSRFDIKQGLAESAALVFDTNSMSVVGGGSVNLRTEQLDLSLKPSPKEGVGISGIGKISMSLSELARPFKLGGTLANPSLAIDPSQTAITIGKAIGGVALFGPVGILSALASGSSGEANPCLAAIEAANKGVIVSGGEKPAEKKGAPENAPSGLKEGLKGVGDELKKLFGK